MSDGYARTDRRRNDAAAIAAWPNTDPRRVRGRSASLAVAAFVSLCCGCAAYQFGSATIFRPDVQTVHVPIVRNETFRDDLGIRLTEAIVKEIERRTPYKVTGNPNADSVLTCSVVNETKRVLTETRDDDPRALDAAISVRAAWTDRRGQLLMQNSIIPIQDGVISFGQDARLVPEGGQSIATATQAGIENLAERIVSQMEMRW
jgi:hypothetical protein